MTKVKIAVIGGSGLIGVRHCQHVYDCDGCILAAIVDPNPAAAQLAVQYQAVWCQTLDELLNLQNRPQAAIVCTPNHTHVAISNRLLQSNIHVLCEKPISHDVATARSLIKEAHASTANLLIGHHRRFNPYVVGMRKVLDSGVLGTIVAVNGLWMVSKPSDYFGGANDWRRDQSRGGGVISNNLIHDVDLLLYMFGPIRRVHAEKSLATRGESKHPVEEGAALTFRFSSGIVGTFLIADNAVSPHSFESGTGENPNIPFTGRDCYRVFGTRGTLSFPDMALSTQQGNPTWNKTVTTEIVTIPDVGRSPLATQLEHFVQVCHGQVLPNCTGEDGLNALVVCEAVRSALSSDDGGTITLWQTAK